MSLQPLQPRYKPYAGAAAGWRAAQRGALLAGQQTAVQEPPRPAQDQPERRFRLPRLRLGRLAGRRPGEVLRERCQGSQLGSHQAPRRRGVLRPLQRQRPARTERLLAGIPGRLTGPMRYDPLSDHYQPITWDAAFALVAEHLRRLDSPDQAEFYTPGGPATRRPTSTSCSSARSAQTTSPTARTCATKPAAWHWAAASGSARQRDLRRLRTRRRDLHPWAEPRHQPPAHARAAARGSEARCPGGLLQPSQERGLERFQHPQNALEMLTNGSSPLNTAFFRPALGGDMAAIRGIAKFLLAWEREAQAEGSEPVFDHAFIAEHRRPRGLPGRMDATPGNTWSASPG